MQPQNPRFRVRVRELENPIGNYTHAISVCPRCNGHIGITGPMLTGAESIICKGKLGRGVCNGHYYFRQGMLEFVGTAKN